MNICWLNPFTQWEIIATGAIVLFEYISGVAKAQKLHVYGSDVNIQGFAKHVTYFVGAASMEYFALMFGAEFVAVPIMLAFMYPYCVSIIANWALYGVTFPAVVTNFVDNEMKQKKKRIEKHEI